VRLFDPLLSARPSASNNSATIELMFVKFCIGKCIKNLSENWSFVKMGQKYHVHELNTVQENVNGPTLVARSPRIIPEMKKFHVEVVKKIKTLLHVKRACVYVYVCVCIFFP